MGSRLRPGPRSRSNAPLTDDKDLVRRGYEAISHRYRGDYAMPPLYAAWLRLLVDRLSARADVLDLGCGRGVPMARDLTSRAHRVLGVGLSAVQIDRVRRLVPTLGSVRPTRPRSCSPPP